MRAWWGLGSVAERSESSNTGLPGASHHLLSACLAGARHSTPPQPHSLGTFLAGQESTAAGRHTQPYILDRFYPHPTSLSLGHLPPGEGMRCAQIKQLDKLEFVAILNYHISILNAEKLPVPGWHRERFSILRRSGPRSGPEHTPWHHIPPGSPGRYSWIQKPSWPRGYAAPSPVFPFGQR